MASDYTQWTEDELRSEIARLDDLLDEAGPVTDERSRCVVNYLRELQRDRRDALTVLRKRRGIGVH